MFDLYYSKQSLGFMKNSDKVIVKRIIKKIDSLKINPFPQDMKRIKGDRRYRIRIGKIRVLYEVDYNKSLIGIIKIDKREKVYD